MSENLAFDHPAFRCYSASYWGVDTCKGEGPYKEHEGKKYCVLHYPDVDKSPEFERAITRKLEAKDHEFTGVWFPDIAIFYSNDFG